MAKVYYDTPVEVPKNVYYKLMDEFAEIVAGSFIEGKYYIKLWDMRYKKELNNRLNKLIK